MKADEATFNIPTNGDEHVDNREVARRKEFWKSIKIYLEARKEPEEVSIDGVVAGVAALAA